MYCIFIILSRRSENQHVCLAFKNDTNKNFLSKHVFSIFSHNFRNKFRTTRQQATALKLGISVQLCQHFLEFPFHILALRHGTC